MNREFWNQSVFGTNAVVVALFLAALVMFTLVQLPADRRLDVHALQLLVIASIYLGFAVNDGRTTPVTIEVIGFFVFLPLVLLGLWVSPYFIIVGYIGHGIWD
ncbi:MAG: hypothetical protein AAF125_10865, partial [Chloroflexota bacterium]